MQIFEKALVPAISMMYNEDGKYAEEVWKCLREYPYQERYKIYQVWGSNLIEECPELARMKQKNLEEFRKSMK